MASSVRIGFVGTGGIAESHISHLKEIPEAQIVAVCDVNEERVKKVAADLGAAPFTNSAKLLSDAKLDALYVCVPPHAHGDLEVRAAQKGLHLFVEKPVSLFIEEAVKARAAIKSAGVMTQVGYSLRYCASSVQLKALLAERPVGTAHIFRWGGIPGAPWWRRYDQSGGQLVEQTTHLVDLLRWVMGEVETVAASYSFKRVLKSMTDVTIPDSQAVLLHFASGASATVTSSCATGRTGMNSIDFVIENAKVNWRHDALKIDPQDSGIPVPPAPREVPSIDASFIRAIATGNPKLLRSSYEDATKSLAVTLAANKSAEEGGRMVKVSEILKD